MTKGELVEILDQYDDDINIYIGSDMDDNVEVDYLPAGSSIDHGNSRLCLEKPIIQLW